MLGSLAGQFGDDNLGVEGDLVQVLQVEDTVLQAEDKELLLLIVLL